MPPLFLIPADYVLVNKAKEVRANSYSPYSKFRVGAAVLSEKNQTYVGTNVENVSYGLTICAERNAIFNGVANEGPSFKIWMIAVVCGVPGPPCGACRQVIAEFSTPETKIIWEAEKGYKIATLDEILPDAFLPRVLMNDLTYIGDE